MKSEQVQCLREALPKKMPNIFGHFPFGWPGLNACPDGLGHLVRDGVSQSDRFSAGAVDMARHVDRFDRSFGRNLVTL